MEGEDETSRQGAFWEPQLPGSSLARLRRAHGAPRRAASCTPATNIEAIVDDSISMEFTDANRLRVQAMNLLIDTLGNRDAAGRGRVRLRRLRKQPSRRRHRLPAAAGRPQRGRDADRARPEDPRRQRRHRLQRAPSPSPTLDNPSADARIFLTDGGHDVGTYNEAHLVHNVPTYVIGFGGIAAGEDQARLKKIAGDTGGRYFPLDDSAQLQSVMNTIEAALTCQTPPRSSPTCSPKARARSTASRSAPRPSRFRSP